MTVVDAPARPLPDLDSPEAAIAVATALAGVPRSGPSPEELAGSGLLAIGVPEALGGPGLPRGVAVEAVGVLAAADPALARQLVSQLVLQQAIADFGTPATQELVFSAVLRGERLDRAIAGRDGEHVAGVGRRPVQGPPTLAAAYDHVLHAAIDVGIARAALRDGAELVRGAEERQAGVVERFGALTVRLQAAEALLERAAARIDTALAAPALDRQNTADASLIAAAARTFASETGREIADAVLELAGPPATGAPHDLARHRRDVRDHARHEPARWTHRHIGDHTLDGVLPPRHPLI